ncbi:MAG: P-loop NTPase fold protein [Pseudomonadota bacterium]
MDTRTSADFEKVGRDSREISSPEVLEKWLAEKPMEWAQVIAVRSALRVFPMVLKAIENRHLHPESWNAAELVLQTWRASIFAISVARSNDKSLTIELAKAAEAVKGPPTGEAPRVALYAADSIHHAGMTLVDVPLRNLAEVMDNSLKAAADAVERIAEVSRPEARGHVSRAINVDFGYLELSPNRSSASGLGSVLLSEASNALMELPLWPIDIEGVGAMEPSIPRWAADPLDEFERQEQSSNWKLIVDWYRALLPDPPDQKPYDYLGEKASIAIASLPNEFWTVSDERSPDDIMDAVVDEARKNGAEWDPIGGVRFVKTEVPDTPTPDPDLEQVTHKTNLTDDRPQGDEDHLGRADIAFMLANRLQQIWDNQNNGVGDGPTPSFVVHVDAPWGGGKTTFANYLLRILNPHKNGDGNEPWKDELPQAQLDYWADKNPWHTVWFNAWQKQHVRPPWWTFYNGFLQSTLNAVWHAGFAKVFVGKDYLPGDRRWLPDIVRNKYEYVEIWFREYLWRLVAPGNRTRIIVAILSALAFLTLYLIGALEFQPPEGEESGGWQWAGDAAGLIAIATFAWSTFGAFAKSLFIGTPDAANNYSLGAEDPYQHFKKHYDRYCRELGRPILVVVDDLDRCDPDYVTELLSGFQTILASPRVLILLLGDKDWLEESFAQSKKEMKEIDVGPEHTFGGRFVEKVIQLSITLPEIDEDTRGVYLRELLGVGDEAAPETAQESETGSVFKSALAEHALTKDDFEKIDRAVLQSSIENREFAAFSTVDEIVANNAAVDEKKLRRSVARVVAMQASTDEEKEERIRHQLSGLAYVLPPNPRQIKRIINTVAIISGVALSEQEVREGTTEWRKLARWIVLMIEWPQTWFTLTQNPDVAETLNQIWNSQDPDKIKEGLPDTKASKWAMKIDSNEEAKNLLRFKLSNDQSDWPATEPIEKEDIEMFADIMPATSGSLLELPKPKKPEAAGAAS